MVLAMQLTRSLAASQSEKQSQSLQPLKTEMLGKASCWPLGIIAAVATVNAAGSPSAVGSRYAVPLSESGCSVMP
jgi:hypothetical protein